MMGLRGGLMLNAQLLLGESCRRLGGRFGWVAVCILVMALAWWFL